MKSRSRSPGHSICLRIMSETIFTQFQTTIITIQHRFVGHLGVEEGLLGHRLNIVAFQNETGLRVAQWLIGRVLDSRPPLTFP